MTFIKAEFLSSANKLCLCFSSSIQRMLSYEWAWRLEMKNTGTSFIKDDDTIESNFLFWLYRTC